MNLHRAFLELAEELCADGTDAATDLGQAKLRRALSTAYYALFHYLIDVSSRSLAHREETRLYLMRSYDHDDMRNTCESFLGNLSNALQRACKETVGEVFTIPEELKDVARLFIKLRKQREDADYSTTYIADLLAVQTIVAGVRSTIEGWPAIEHDPVTHVFLAALLLRRQFEKHTKRGD